jgi:hypothetical protein
MRRGRAVSVPCGRLLPRGRSYLGSGVSAMGEARTMTTTPAMDDSQLPQSARVLIFSAVRIYRDALAERLSATGAIDVVGTLPPPGRPLKNSRDECSDCTLQPRRARRPTRHPLPAAIGAGYQQHRPGRAYDRGGRHRLHRSRCRRLRYGRSTTRPPRRRDHEHRARGDDVLAARCCVASPRSPPTIALNQRPGGSRHVSERSSRSSSGVCRTRRSLQHSSSSCQPSRTTSTTS